MSQVQTYGPKSVGWTSPKYITTRYDVHTQADASRNCPSSTDEVILLTSQSSEQGVVGFSFQGTSVTVYGSVLGTSLVGYATYLDSEQYQLHSFPTTGCDGVLVTYNGLAPGVTHTLRVSIVYPRPIGGQASRLAIYNATVNLASTQPESSTSTASTPIVVPTPLPPVQSSSPIPSSSPSTSPTPPSLPSSSSAPSPQQPPNSQPSSSSSVQLPSGVSEGSSKPPQLSPHGAAPPASHSRTGVLIGGVAAALGVALIFILVFVYYFRRRRNRRLRNALPGEELLRPYDIPPSPPMISGAAAATIKHPELAVTITPAGRSAHTVGAAGAVSSFPQDVKYQALNLKPPSNISSPSEMFSPDSVYSTSTSSASTPRHRDDVEAPLLPANPADAAALEHAVRRAGFSVQSVVASLSRLSTSQYAPTPITEPDEAPPLYDSERRIGSGR
ncbi:hypothetical protein EXIGLDRAFT_832346 [Exidia glandulosa HHB12029]|uniref:Uncharacterized protein n=1 Tax=Exidia glandulosa HHB12029 TaxID=1314781 RepID=A0A165LSG0_EXIGL|nr:hypothetical protein EXIGLDRAFT_832346 [Exidia glandulosa HHB12029]